MRPTVACSSLEVLEWFLEKAAVSAVYATGEIPGAAFPIPLREAAAGVSVAIDFASATTKTLAAFLQKSVPAGDCLVFVGRTLVGRTSEIPPKTGQDWLAQFVATLSGEPRDERAEKPREALIRLLGDALSRVGWAPQLAEDDPYQVLGIRSGIPLAEARRARLLRLAAYHPDRVAQLGVKIREVAEAESRRINWAYEEVRKAHALGRAPSPRSAASARSARSAKASGSSHPAPTRDSDGTAFLAVRKKPSTRRPSPSSAGGASSLEDFLKAGKRQLRLTL